MPLKDFIKIIRFFSRLRLEYNSLGFLTDFYIHTEGFLTYHNDFIIQNKMMSSNLFLQH